MTPGNRQKTPEKFVRLRAPPNRQKIDDLDEESRLAAAGASHASNQLGEPGQEAIVTDSQERSARNVSNPGGFDHQRARAAARETLVPIEHVFGHEALFGRAPRHHRRNPGSMPER